MIQKLKIRLERHERQNETDYHYIDFVIIGKRTYRHWELTKYSRILRLFKNVDIVNINLLKEVKKGVYE